jgi:murein DD-endopeptidase MepM/ murein hydrolase activator NlpD
VSRGTFVVCQRRDRPVYFHKKTSIWSAHRQTVAIVSFTVIALITHASASVQSSATQAQEPNRVAAISGMPANGFEVFEVLKEKRGGLELEEFLGKVIPTETIATTTPSLWPVQGRLTDGFGNRRNPFHRKSSEFHPGQDIAAPKGTPVSVTADGTVVFAGSKNGYGQIVIVDHGNNITTRYGHLSLIEAALGSVIKRGEEIGLVGSTGRSTGSHLHYEVRVGVDQVPVNPLAYLPTDPPETRAK